MSEYLLDNSAAAAGARLEALARLFDPSTFRHLAALGITRGWRCWEVGAGGRSVVRWMAEQVGDEGQVVASDIDVSWAEAAGEGRYNVSVRSARHLLGSGTCRCSRDRSSTRPNRSGAVKRATRHGSTSSMHASCSSTCRTVSVRSRRCALRSVRGGWLLVEDADPSLQPLSCLEGRIAGRGAGQPAAKRLPRP